MAVILLLTNLLLVCSSVTTLDVMRYASVQYSILYNEFVDSSGKFYPFYGDPLKEDWQSTTAISGWTSGFFPGVLWNLVEYNATRESLKRAMDVTAPTALYTNFTSGIDIGNIGFVIMSGFGNGYRLLKVPQYLDIILASANRLATEFSTVVQCTEPWNHTGTFLIYIDFMMNLEILFEAANHTNNQTLFNIAWQYANRTMYDHFRPDNSTYHILEYNRTDCSVIRKYTTQGYADWSTWSRGQSWAVHGYTIAYRYTKYQPFLDKAIGAANYILTHLPSSTDLIPYWDYNAPYNSTISYQPRDTSAAAIFASGLVELSQYAPTTDLKDRFLTSAKTIVDQLSSSQYMMYGHRDYKLPALLANGTMGPYPKNPYDVSLVFGDYYFTQAILRLSKL